jgi:hypothetical protein
MQRFTMGTQTVPCGAQDKRRSFNSFPEREGVRAAQRFAAPHSYGHGVKDAAVMESLF